MGLPYRVELRKFHYRLKLVSEEINKNDGHLVKPTWQF